MTLAEVFHGRMRDDGELMMMGGAKHYKAARQAKPNVFVSRITTL